MIPKNKERPMKQKEHTIKWVFATMFETAPLNIEMALCLLGTLLLPLLPLLYAVHAELQWTGWQMAIAYGQGFDIMGGCLVYNSAPFKRLRSRERDFWNDLGHALLHIQPLVIASFFQQRLLRLTGLYWLVLYLVILLFFEPRPRMSKKAERIITTVLVFSNLIILGLFLVTIKDQNMALFGAVYYLLLAILTAVQYHIPIRAQRLFGTMLVIGATIASTTLLTAPEGLQWFIPVLSIKIFMGYNAREHISIEKENDK
jgi:hypothetical protein